MPNGEKKPKALSISNNQQPEIFGMMEFWNVGMMAWKIGIMRYWGIDK
jgi:hypothetical protein